MSRHRRRRLRRLVRHQRVRAEYGASYDSNVRHALGLPRHQQIGINEIYRYVMHRKGVTFDDLIPSWSVFQSVFQ